MRIVVVREDGIIAIDGVIREADLSIMVGDKRIIQWYDVIGHYEYYDDETPNSPINDISEIQDYIDLWEAGAPPTPSAEDIKEATIAEWRMEFWKYMDNVATSSDQYSSLLEAMCYASVPNIYQADSIALVEWSALAKEDAKNKLLDLENDITTLAGTYDNEVINFLDSLPIFTWPG